MPLVAPFSKALAPQLGVLLADSFGWQYLYHIDANGRIVDRTTMAQPKEAPEVKQTSIKTDIKTLLKSKPRLRVRVDVCIGVSSVLRLPNGWRRDHGLQLRL